ncbi:MFS transporter [Levilactobacillus enshiensis]|uniref:MFS transporter n=1 Tax=Levilactobacillus enshiensis TaxID=2590213 RepID=UPI001179B2F7|nr:MFS transporter [Levilactobacillus enshiensis]
MTVFLHNRRYRILTLASFISMLGSTLFNIVFVIYARGMSNAKLAVSIASIVATLPFLLDIIAGYLADETNHHFHSMMVVKCGQAALFLGLSGLIAFHPSWWVFTFLLLINIVSDFAGSYSSFVSLAVIKDVVTADDLAEARGFESGVGSTISLVGGLAGAGLIAALHYNYVLFGLLNAASFIVAFLILWGARQHFRQIKSSQFQQHVAFLGVRGEIRHFFTTSMKNLKLLKTFSTVTGFMVAFSIVNFIGSGQSTLLNLSYIQEKKLLFGNFGYTVALIDLVESVGMILGSFTPMKRVAWLSIPANLSLVIGVSGVISANLLWLQSREILVACILVNGVLIGLLNPRIQAEMITELPEESIGSILSVFYTVIQLTVPGGAIVFAFLANGWTIAIAWLGLVVAIGGGLLYAEILRRRLG